ncbi:undecaprenyl-diphosphatase [Nocardia sp. 852002-20019_SCH5090214]|jgi:undecaprenyl-diphosphatase|uniref:Undecaprenyl-diphosphatase n=1 Tax=Nocardia nova TaxID=37330 RepID=A0A2S6A1B6_9NOCA|nr:MULTISPECIES: undecaprenyl-diphosphate phosphatase [Nocardia]OBF78045.1 undecaprenyl-diphosphatase [Mycobacterium sp. 852002-51759_SCH5129042]MBF6276164.1 undecaprenyl-diphosphate phosphatase [Nocardia nova]MBV7702837.1 undecaprenyl-diphosphate phosphatase [Nocardia nova]OBA42476.1 undecaprenyl-diphosphatase [Nocardia sp. 852002-20019_SCH5090214]OBA47604.1 undecaprenyl-diphosphatase [Nocardia sp. 852002-51101_SCH5132738]
MLTYFEAMVIGAVQGFTELFPISSLGHSVLVAAWLGGRWGALADRGGTESAATYLAFVVALHVATAVALVIYYRRDWCAIIVGFVEMVRTRRLDTVPQRLAWLIIVATVPVAVLGPLLEHPLHDVFAAPLCAAAFLTVNGVVLVVGEGLRRRNEPTLAEYGRRFALNQANGRTRTATTLSLPQSDRRLAALDSRDAVGIGLAQAGALLTGFSRAGLTMVGGLWRGLEHEHAAKFAFLLATPAIFGAGIVDLPDLISPRAEVIWGPILVGAVVSGVTSWFAVRYLERYFQTRTLLPFAAYCVIVGVVSIVRFG